MSQNQDNFLNEDSVKANLTWGQLLKALWPYIKKHSFLFFIATASIFLMAGVSRALPYLIGYTVDEAIVKKDAPLFATLAWMYLALQVAKTILQFGYSYLFQKFGNLVLFDYRSDLIAKVQSLPLQYFNKTPTGRIVTRITNDVANMGELFSEGVVSVFVELVLIISIVVALYMTSPILATITLIVTPAFLWASIKISDRIRLILRESKKQLSKMNSFAVENINGIKVVQLNNRLEKNLNTFQTLSREYFHLNIQSLKSYALMQPLTNIFNAVILSSALLIGGWMTFENQLAIGALVTFLLNVQDFIFPLREILDKYQQYQNSLTSAERVINLNSELSEVDDGQIQAKIIGKIEFRHLTFSYDSNLKNVLTDISFKVDAGSSVAIIGRTGSGKSTLVSLLQRLYEAPRGTILIDDQDILDFKKSSLRKQMGIVSQDNFIFQGTIFENVSLMDEQISSAQVTQALQKIGYMDLLKSTGRDINFKLDERGANISSGERQLISFARILVFSPQILILDEATSSIDSKTEELIKLATKEVIKGRTSFIIAHRLSTIKDCNQVIELSDGLITSNRKAQNILG